jgi:type IV pilus assembly protein PilO
MPAPRPSKWLLLRAQFSSLDFRDPSRWPLVPRLALCIAVSFSIMGGLWMGLISGNLTALTEQEAQEDRLKVDYTRKLGQAANLAALRKQREQVRGQVNELEKQLPGRAEMDALLSDINQAGLGRGLTFELFRPGPVVVRDYYAEQPIALKVLGRYHDIGAFAADIANLSRIVTLNNIAISPVRDGGLVMEATAKTFRYLDPEEVAAQRRVAPGTAPAGSGASGSTQGGRK